MNLKIIAQTSNFRVLRTLLDNLMPESVSSSLLAIAFGSFLKWEGLTVVDKRFGTTPLMYGPGYPTPNYTQIS